MARRIYCNPHAYVEGEGRSDGSVVFTAYPDEPWPRALDFFVGTEVPRVWREPWTWCNDTPADALSRAVSVADAYAHRKDLAQFNLDQAEESLRGLQAQAEILEELNREIMI